MATNGLFSETISLLERSLNIRSLQHRVLSSNIANLDTPNYKAIELAVAEEINGSQNSASSIQLVQTQPGHLPLKHNPVDNLKLKAAKPPEFSLRGDGNTVDLDRTMGELAENTLLYRTAAQLISRKFSGLKSAIRGGHN
ncbi:MAG: flagellar basal body rod protein FlgB [Desulfobacterales bacterium]|jgi:flagellar basal-body rod protein FlgB